jgi:hypothetical protein
MKTRSSWRNSDEMICVPAGLDEGFKRCCLVTGKYDGTNRDYFLPRVAPVCAARVSRIFLLDFRFLFAIVTPYAMANGGRLHCLP